MKKTLTSQSKKIAEWRFIEKKEKIAGYF